MKPGHNVAGAVSSYRRPLIAAALLLFSCGSAWGQRGGAPGRQPPFKDISVQETTDRIIFSNSRVSVEIGKPGGDWLGLTAQGLPGRLASRTSGPAALDFRIDDAWMVEKYGATFLRRQASVDEGRDAATLCAVLGVGPRSRPPLIPERWMTRAGQSSPASYEYELSSCYTLFANQARLERSASVRRIGGADILASTYSRFQGFLFAVPNAAPGRPEDCTIEVPGPVFLGTYLPPGTPYPSAAKRFLSTGSAPDGGFGIVAIVNAAAGRTLAAWMETTGEAAWNTYLSGDGDRLTVLDYDRRMERMGKDSAVKSGTQRIELVEGLAPAAYARYREMTVKTLPLAATPEWSKEMVLLEVLPSYFEEGIRGLTRKLPFYRKTGFNAVYLMPHWRGGYSPIDPFQVDPAAGTPEELKEMVRTAHSLGMRVLFDMVIHGFNPRSDMMRRHPEFFAKDEFGIIVPHETWGSMSTDPASPAYQQYMVDLALHDLRTYDIDGYRVDANGYKLPNWDPKAPYSQTYSSEATRQMLEKMLQAMQAVKPESVLLSEIWGPVWYSISNLVHDNMTQGPEYALELMQRGEFTPAQYKEHIARIMDLLPEGALRVRFARNHDTSWFYHFDGYTPRFMAMEAVHAFFGIPEVFAGDRGNPPYPDTGPGVYEYYGKLFAARRKFPELAAGEVLFREAESANPWVIAGLRRLNGNTSLVVISMSDKEEVAKVTVRGGSPGRKVELGDPISGARVTGELDALRLKAFQVLVGRL